MKHSCLDPYINGIAASALKNILYTFAYSGNFAVETSDMRSKSTCFNEQTQSHSDIPGNGSVVNA